MSSICLLFEDACRKQEIAWGGISLTFFVFDVGPCWEGLALGPSGALNPWSNMLRSGRSMLTFPSRNLFLASLCSGYHLGVPAFVDRPFEANVCAVKPMCELIEGSFHQGTLWRRVKTCVLHHQQQVTLSNVEFQVGFPAGRSQSRWLVCVESAMSMTVRFEIRVCLADQVDS